MRVMIHKSILLFAISLFFSCSSENEEILIEDISDIESQEDIQDQDATILPTINRNLSLPAEYFNYANVDLPNAFLNAELVDEDNTPNTNPVTDAGATLGRVLFYDVNLSANNTISCASCHIQSNGFSDPNQFSTGFNRGQTPRNSMGLANAMFYENGRFFWDERAATLEEQTLQPIQDLTEMGMTLDALEEKLSALDYYDNLFDEAFNSNEITSDKIALAISQFIRSMMSYESKFDDGLVETNDARVPFANYIQSENRGKQLFFSNQTQCAQCHTTNAFVGDRARNNGLDAMIIDEGVGGVTGNNNQLGEFKAPSLRNIQFTGPYMHDGRFNTLLEVVEHYNSGVQDNATLDNRLRVGNGVRRLNLSDADKQAIVDFMVTLTDPSFLTNEKFSDPFED